MKTIELKNKDLIAAVLFLKSLSMDNKASRGKQKFIDRLIEKNTEYAKQEEVILKPFCQLDNQDNLIIENDRFKLKEGISKEEESKIVEQRKELQDEIAEISFVEYSKKYDALFTALENWPEIIEAEHSYIFDKLMDEYEKEEPKKEEDK